MLRLLRMLAMGVHFLISGALNLAICLARPFDPDNSRKVARVYGWAARRLLGMEIVVDLSAAPAGRAPAVYVCNHQSNLDLFVLGPAVPERTVTVGKQSLRWVPLFGQIFWLAGNVLIDRGDPAKAKASMLRARAKLVEGSSSIWIFPEGTRDRGESLLPFKHGAFRMAIEAGVPIVPVCVSGYLKAMDLSKARSCKVVIQALEPIPTEGLGLQSFPELMERVHAAMELRIRELDIRASS